MEILWPFLQAKVLEFRKRPITTSCGDHDEAAGFLASEEGWALEQGGKRRSALFEE